MATNLTDFIANIGLSITGVAEKALDLSTPKSKLSIAKNLALAFGSGAGKADQVWHDRRILAGGGSEDLDLSGVLINAFGDTITFANLKVIAIINRSDEVLPGHAVATDAEVSIAPDATNGFDGPLAGTTPKLIVPAGGVLLVTNPTAAGWAVTADTGDLIVITNEDGSDQAIYDILVIGESA